jgi:HK97 family phage portal protein
MIWDWIFPQRKRIEDSGALARVLRDGNTAKSGVSVTLESALGVSTVLACARVIGEGCAQTPIKLIEKREGARIQIDDHPAARLFWYEPNEWMTPFELIEMMAMHLCLAGNAFAFLTRGQNGQVLEMLPLEPGWVTVKQMPDWSIEYRVKFPGGGAAEVVPSGNIWHVRGPAWASYYGLNIVSLARDAIGLAMATEEYGSSLFKNGGRPGGVLSTEQKLDKELQENLRAQWREAHEGSGNAMRTAVLSGGLKYEALAMTSDEAQFMDTRKLQVEEVCRFMRVLPIMIGHSGDKNATFASAEQMFNVHDKAHLGPWFSRIEQSASKRLLTAAERQRGFKLKFMANGLMRASAKDRAEYFKAALGAGGSPAWMTQDEVRAFDDLNPMGGAAAALPVPTNVAPVGQE